VVARSRVALPYFGRGEREADGHDKRLSGRVPARSIVCMFFAFRTCARNGPPDGYCAQQISSCFFCFERLPSTHGRSICRKIFFLPGTPIPSLNQDECFHSVRPVSLRKKFAVSNFKFLLKRDGYSSRSE
jgi:hypothetical protein